MHGLKLNVFSVINKSIKQGDFIKSEVYQQFKNEVQNQFDTGYIKKRKSNFEYFAIKKKTRETY